MAIEKKKILVRVPNWIGDAVICLPALEALKALYPASAISVLARARTAPLFIEHPSVEEVLLYDKEGRHNGFKGRLKLAKELRKRKFDLAVLFQNAFEAALVALLAGIPERVGYARDLRGSLLTKSLKASGEITKKHQVYYYLNIVEALGAKAPDAPVPVLYVSEDEERKADELLASLSVDSDRTLIGVAPGASYGPAKRWPAEKFAAVLGKVAEESGALTLIFGGPDDKADASALADKLGGDYIDLAGKTDLRGFIALAGRLSLFLTNDSGPMHITAALGVPTVAIFASTEPKLTGPLGPVVSVASSAVDCRPCFKRECDGRDYECMDDIGVEEVLKEALCFVSKKGRFKGADIGGERRVEGH